MVNENYNVNLPKGFCSFFFGFYLLGGSFIKLDGKTLDFDLQNQGTTAGVVSKKKLNSKHLK
jgi:hypothetical protein